jgi:HAE1 family hydrophobic/amphiphilic exporter-1
MTFSDVAIRRPVLTWMMTAALIVFGVLGYNRLGVDQFPTMEFPVVIITSVLEGASPEVVEEDVTDVIEEHVNTIAGLRSLRSITSEGLSMVIAEFELERDVDSAAQDIRDKISLARAHLPRELEPPVIDKVNPADHPILWIPLYTDRSQVDTSEFVRYQIKPYLETISGVGAVVLFGRRDRNIRIWLDGEELGARGLAATDVLGSIRREHVDIPSGRVESRLLEYSVKTEAEFKSVEELEGLVIAHIDGKPVRLRDVARVEDGSEEPRTLARYNGLPTVGLGLQKQPGANTVAIADEAVRRMERIEPTLPSGFAFPEKEGLIDFSQAIRESVAETQFALVFGALLATLTVFVFLRRTRPTLIVGAAIPLSLVATFGVMWILGFTLNVMTLLALALAVGVVIDDAIVVLENIERHRERGEKPFDAASNGTRQIAFAATAATFSIAAVFFPVAAVTGIVGNFLKEFGLTVASAVVISLFVALTLTPMLAARMPAPKEREHGSIYHRLEQFFEALERNYKRLLYWSLSHRTATLGVALLSLVLAIGFGRSLGVEFFPPEDQGRLLVRLQTPPGTSLEGTEQIMQVQERWMLDQPEIAGLFSAIGIVGPGRSGTTNQGIMFAVLHPRDERKRTAQDLIVAARERFATIPGQRTNVFDISTMASSGSRGADFEVFLRGNLPLADLDVLADQVIRELEAKGGIVDLDKSLKLGLPEIRVVPDREKAAALGVDATSLGTVIQAMIGGMDIATFKEGGHRYDIRVRLDQEDRARPESIERLYARGRDGQLVKLRNLVRIESGAAPSQITRSDRQRSVTIWGNLQGKELGTAVADAREIARRILPEGVSITLSGEAEVLRESFSQFRLMLLLALVVIYMVLAAQFESFIHPLTVMLALPLAMVGALGGLLATGMTINLFSMIGIVLLFGLVTKNSILLVDYANRLRGEGRDKVDAMRTAAPIRMRPVLMTAISMIFGVLPAALGVGPGSESRQPMAIATAAGMFSSTLLTLVVVPVFYLVLDDFVEWLKALPARLLRREAIVAEPTVAAPEAGAPEAHFGQTAVSEDAGPIVPDDEPSPEPRPERGRAVGARPRLAGHR